VYKLWSHKKRSRIISSRFALLDVGKSGFTGASGYPYFLEERKNA
jgi:hypothetical protein